MIISCFGGKVAQWVSVFQQSHVLPVQEAFLAFIFRVYHLYSIKSRCAVETNSILPLVFAGHTFFDFSLHSPLKHILIFKSTVLDCTCLCELHESLFEMRLGIQKEKRMCFIHHRMQWSLVSYFLFAEVIYLALLINRFSCQLFFYKQQVWFHCIIKYTKG